MKKILCMVLTVVMLFTMIPADIMAEDTDTYENTVWSTDGVMALAADTTYESGNYTYTLDEDKNAVITGFTGSVSALVIPSELDGHEVTAIGDRVFKNNSNLRSVVVPNTVIKIGAETFYNCANLGNVTLSANLQEMGKKAFGNCVSLTEIEIPKSLKTCHTNADYLDNVYDGPFDQCESLKNITFESGTKQIASCLFAGCTGLKNIKIPETVTIIYSKAFNGCENLGKIEIPDSVTEIERGAFGNCGNMVTAQIGNGVTTIGDAAFLNCKKLSGVKLSANLQEMGKKAFGNCVSLTEIEIPKGLKTCHTNADYLDNVYDGPFDQCEALKNITFENGTKQIASCLFAGCTGLKNIEIPNTVTIIDKKAFNGCKNLEKIEIPDGVTTIKWSAFSNCENMVTAQIGDSATGIESHIFMNCTKLKSVKLPSTLKYITSSMFYNCKSLASVELPDTVISIEASAFENTGLEEIKIPDNTTLIDKNAFKNSALKKANISDGVTNIQDSAFYGCDMLAEAVIPDSVTTLGTHVFEDCDMLENVTLGTGVTTIPSYAFHQCAKLTDIVLPYRVTTVKDHAFTNCVKLKSITVPRATTMIDQNAFSYSGSMTMYGVDGTYAKTYADDVGMTFIGQEKKAESVSLKDTEISMNNGSKISLQMTVEPLDFTDEVTWKSTDTSVAEVDNSGVLTAKKIGSATIKVIVGDCSASCKVTVVQPVTRITLDCNSLTMESQEQYTLKTNISPNSASNKDLFWTSSDDKVATVDENGTITAISKGNAIITVQAAGGSDVKATCNVTVKNNGYVVDDISEMESTHNYENNCSDYWIYTKKGAAALKVIFDSKTEIEDGFDYLYIYDESGENIGKYTGDQLAGATITVPGDTVKIQLISDDGGNAWGFKVTDIVEESGYEKKEQILSGTDSYVKTYRDNDFTLDSRVEKGNGTLTFQSLNESVVTVNASGSVHINGAGSAKIKVTAGETSLYKSTSMEISITVNKAAQNIDAYLSNSTISIGESATIYASCDTGRLSFRSQNENVAVIDGEGTVTGKNTGTAVIRVTAEENNNYHAATKEFYITVTTAVSGETNKNNDSVDSPEENKTSADSVFEKNIEKKFNLKATALSAGKVKLKWKKVSKVNGYQIRYATKSSMKSAKTKKISGAGKTGITLKGLKKGKKYYFQLRAYKKFGSKTYYSKWSSKVRKKVKK